ncbi:MAG: HEAT repeat domain-containing protein, partial [Polyangiales bacterium]
PAEAAEPLALMLAKQDSPTPALIAALGAIGTERAIAALATALATPSAAPAAEQGLMLAGRRAATPLSRALSSSVAVRVAHVLGEIGAPAAAAALPALVTALSSEAPELRTAAARAVGALGDARAAEPLLALASDPVPEVANAALEALSHVAQPVQARALLALFTRASAAQRPFVLGALAAADPELAAPALELALHAERELRDAALALLEGEHPRPAWIPLLGALFAEEQREATASALARVQGGLGLSALLAQAHRSSDAQQHTARAVAIAVRRFRDELPASTIADAERLLRSLADRERGSFLRALARDRSVRDSLRAALSASDADLRATAAFEVMLLADEALAPALQSALDAERDPEAARRMLEAAAELGVRVSEPTVLRWMADPETAPEALQLAAALADPAAASRSLRVRLRRALASHAPLRVRVAAALALGRLGDRAARPALVAALDESSARLRLAAVRALGALGGAGSVYALQAHARIERDALVRRAALQEAAHAGVPSRVEHGDLVLELRVRAQVAAESARPFCDVLLQDGRWLRYRARANGELVVADLPAGVADVRILD